MRSFLPVLLLFGTATSAVAQDRPTLERRVNQLEEELRAVQRKVFPGGAGTMVSPEVVQQQQPAGEAGVPASSALADLTARVDALETQLRSLTGQIEESGHQLRLVQDSVTQLRSETESRLSALEHPAPPPPPAAEAPRPTEEPAATADNAPAADPAETAYVSAYRAWTAHHYTDAQKTLEDLLAHYPRYPHASLARNLLGRAYLDDGKPATAAKTFLSNYQTDPKGERAPDSLYFLGQALVQLGKRPEACQVYDELQDVYGTTMRDWVRQRLAPARKDARCS